jgi:hypothetical protein
MKIPGQEAQRSWFALCVPLALILFAPGKISGLDLAFTRAGLEGFFVPEYNKSFSWVWNLRASGWLELNGRLRFSGGLSAGRIGGGAEAGAFAAVEYGLPFLPPFLPLSVKAAWIFESALGAAVHTFLPVLSLRRGYFGFSLGPALRFSSFGSGEPPLYEINPAYLVYANLYNTGEASTGMELSNTDDFSARNLGAFSLALRNRFRIARGVSLICDAEALMSGNTAHIVSVYGLTFREGIRFTW